MKHCLFLLFVAILAPLVSSLSPSSALSANQKNLVILGLGNVGQALFHQVTASATFSVRCATRNPQEDSVLTLTWEHLEQLLPYCTHLVITIPPNPTISDLLLLLSHHPHLLPGWIGVVSTTGVYGNHDGAWVTEDSPLQGALPHPYATYEQEWAAVAPSLAIFRCAGLYGPTRSALHTVWKEGQPASSAIRNTPATGITNRIHESDVARAILAAMESDAVGIYNLADDEPENRNVVMQKAVELLRSIGREPPMKDEELVLSSSSSSGGRGRRRSSESKRVSNRKMKESLISELTFPTYREGLQSILESKANPWWALEC